MRRVTLMKVFTVVAMTFSLNACLNVDQGVSYTEQLAKDVAAIDQYLSDHSVTALKHASGLRIKISSMGTGLPATINSNIKVKYVGKFISNGVTFDENTTTGIIGYPYNFIQGWQIALTRLPPGTTATLYVPSGLAYGSSGSGSIPKNSNLMFDIEIVSVSYTTAQQTQLNNDKQAIATYLTNNEITTAITDPSGISYEIIQEGAGAAPTLFNKVKLSLKGTLLNNGNEFFANQTVEPSSQFDSYVADYPNGLKAAFMLFPAGTKFKVYVPSTLAYGSNGATGVPANTNVVFEGEILEISL